MSESGNLWLGVFIGFLVIAFLGGTLPIIAHLIGGFLAGWIAGKGMGRGGLAGFAAGVLGGIIATVFLISGLVSLSGIISGLMTEALGLAIRIVAILLNVFGVMVAIGGGIAGSFIRAIIETS